MKNSFLFFLLVLNQSFAQWEFKVNKEKNEINAIGQVKFSVYIPDTILLNLSKSRRLGIDFAIEGDYFKALEKYYVLFEISDRKIKVLSSISEKGKLRILKLKDLVRREEYEIQDFLKILKRGSECILTINSGSQVIQGINKLSGSAKAINSVLTGNYP
jgi:predicted transcriptional regulator